MQTETARALPSALGLLDEPLRSFLKPLEPGLDRLLAIDQLHRSLDSARRAGGIHTMFARLLEELGVEAKLDPVELARIPREGPPAAIEDLSELVACIEGDGKGVPILVRQYLKTGGRLLGFNVDRRFSNVLDALILVDLRELSPSLLERYLGRPGAMAFRAWHAFERGAA